VLQGATLSELDSKWVPKRTWILLAPAVSFALVDGRPMGVGADAKLGYLDLPEPDFTLEAYPPWLLISVDLLIVSGFCVGKLRRFISCTGRTDFP
jgi:hypothetical protein